MKIKLDAYEQFKTSEKKEEKNENVEKNENKKVFLKKDGKKNVNKDEQRCYSCGDSSHSISSCPNKEKGFKCFRCNISGHKASDNVCKESDIKAKKEKEENKNEEKKVTCLNSKSVKEVKLCGKKFEGLIDTGSDINAIRQNLFTKL